MPSKIWCRQGIRISKSASVTGTRGNLSPSTAQTGVEGRDGLELLKAVINAFELGGKEVLFGGEDVSIIGFGVGPHELLCIVDGLLEEMNFFGAGCHFIGGGLVVEESVGDFLACREDGL